MDAVEEDMRAAGVKIKGASKSNMGGKRRHNY